MRNRHLHTARPGLRQARRRLRRAGIAGLAAAALAGTVLPLLAQADAALEEIVVTAQRRVERLQDVPLAITALSADDLTNLGVRQAAIGGAFLDNQLGVRAAVLYEKRDGWVHSVVPGVEPLNGVDALAGRLSFLYKGIENLTASLKFSMTRSGGTPYGAHALNVDPAYFSGTIDWFDNGAKYAVHKDIRNDSVALKIEWLASEHTTLTSVTGFDYGRWYTKSDDGGLPVTGPLAVTNTGRLDV